MLSIIVCNFNDSKYFDKWFGNLAAQTKKPLEVIVVDDCSTDDSVARLEKIQNKFPSLIKLVALKKNVGTFLAFMEGVKVAKGEFVSGWSMDDEMLEQYIEKMETYIGLFKKEDLFLCRVVIEREGVYYHSNQLTGGAILFSPDSFVQGMRDNSLRCFIGHVIRKSVLMDYWKKGGSEIRCAFDAMYIYFTAFNRGAVLINDFLVIYHASYTGFGATRKFKDHRKSELQITEMCKKNYPHIYHRLIESQAFHIWRSIVHRSAMRIVPKLPTFLRKRVYDYIYR